MYLLGKKPLISGPAQLKHVVFQRPTVHIISQYMAGNRLSHVQLYCESFDKLWLTCL